MKIKKERRKKKQTESRMEQFNERNIKKKMNSTQRAKKPSVTIKEILHPTHIYVCMYDDIEQCRNDTEKERAKKN